MAIKVWNKSGVELFWWDSGRSGHFKHFLSISIDYIKWTHPDFALIKLQGMLPDSLDFFRNFEPGDELQLLYKECGPRDKYDTEEAFMSFDITRIKSKWMFNPVPSSPDFNELNFYMKVECEFRN